MQRDSTPVAALALLLQLVPLRLTDEPTLLVLSTCVYHVSRRGEGRAKYLGEPVVPLQVPLVCCGLESDKQVRLEIVSPLLQRGRARGCRGK